MEVHNRNVRLRDGDFIERFLPVGGLAATHMSLPTLQHGRQAPRESMGDHPPKIRTSGFAGPAKLIFAALTCWPRPGFTETRLSGLIQMNSRRLARDALVALISRRARASGTTEIICCLTIAPGDNAGVATVPPGSAADPASAHLAGAMLHDLQPHPTARRRDPEGQATVVNDLQPKLPAPRPIECKSGEARHV